MSITPHRVSTFFWPPGFLGASVLSSQRWPTFISGPFTFIFFYQALCHSFCTGKKKKKQVLLTGALSALGMYGVQLYLSAYPIKNNSGLVVIKSFAVLCNEDTKHSVEITVFHTNLLSTLYGRRRYKGIQSDVYKIIFSKEAYPWVGASVSPRTASGVRVSHLFSCLTVFMAGTLIYNVYSTRDN